MGLRGPMPMTAAQRAASGTRDRTVKTTVAKSVASRLRARAERLEQLGDALVNAGVAGIAAAMKGKRPKGAADPSRQLDAGVKLLRAAEGIWLRLGRVTVSTKAAPGARARAALEAYRRRRPRAGT